MLLFLRDERLDKKVFDGFSVEFLVVFKNVIEIKKFHPEMVSKTVRVSLGQLISKEIDSSRSADGGLLKRFLRLFRDGSSCFR